MKRDGLLFGSEFGKIDAGKLAGAVGVLQENFAGVVEGFYFDAVERKAEERANFCFVKSGVAEAFVFLHDAALRVDHERSRQSADAAVVKPNFVARDGDGIVDAVSGDKFFDFIEIFDVKSEADNLQTIFVFGLELDEVGNFGAARSAPGGPEVEENDFAFFSADADDFAVECGEFEIWSGIGIADEADSGLKIVLGCRG